MENISSHKFSIYDPNDDDGDHEKKQECFREREKQGLTFAEHPYCTPPSPHFNYTLLGTSTPPTQLPVLCSTCTPGSSAKPGSIPPPTFPPILGEQAKQIGRVGSDIWEDLPGGRIPPGVYSRKALHFSLLQCPPPSPSTPFIVSNAPLSFSASNCKSLGQSSPGPD